MFWVVGTHTQKKTIPLWFIYGIYSKDVPLVATNTLTTGFTFFIVFIILKNRK